jgi:transcription termination factor Rho
MEPRRPEGIRDTTAHRMAAAENKPARRPGHTMTRPAPRPSPRQERRKGLEILKLLQQQISIDPFERFQLETTPDLISMRVMDLITPIGRGQRALIVSPPKAGKTTLLIQIAEALHVNHPEVAVYALLVDERPEEVTHFRRSTHATIYAASSDMSTRDHISITEECVNTIVEPVLEGKDVVLLLDSITRLARAYNTVQGNSGRTLSGGLDATTMLAPRQIFGAARKIEDGGSLTILGTALVDTGSRMDEVIFQEFKGTGNTELVLSRDLFEKRIFPSVDIGKSGTRKEEKLYPEDVVGRLHKLRRLAASYPPDQAMLGLLKLMQRHKTNEEVLKGLAAME